MPVICFNFLNDRFNLFELSSDLLNFYIIQFLLIESILYFFLSKKSNIMLTVIPFMKGFKEETSKGMIFFFHRCFSCNMHPCFANSKKQTFSMDYSLNTSSY